MTALTDGTNIPNAKKGDVLFFAINEAYSDSIILTNAVEISRHYFNKGSGLPPMPTDINNPGTLNNGQVSVQAGNFHSITNKNITKVHVKHGNSITFGVVKIQKTVEQYQ